MKAKVVMPGAEARYPALHGMQYARVGQTGELLAPGAVRFPDQGPYQYDLIPKGWLVNVE